MTTLDPFRLSNAIVVAATLVERAQALRGSTNERMLQALGLLLLESSFPELIRLALHDMDVLLGSHDCDDLRD